MVGLCGDGQFDVCVSCVWCVSDVFRKLNVSITCECCRIKRRIFFASYEEEKVIKKFS